MTHKVFVFSTHTEVIIGSNVTLNGLLLTWRQIICLHSLSEIASDYP